MLGKPSNTCKSILARPDNDRRGWRSVKNQSSVCPCPREGGGGGGVSKRGGAEWGRVGGGGVTLFRDQLGAYYFNCGKSVVPSHKGVKIHIHVACSATTTLAEELAPTYYRVTFHIRIRTWQSNVWHFLNTSCAHDQKKKRRRRKNKEKTNKQKRKIFLPSLNTDWL